MRSFFGILLLAVLLVLLCGCVNQGVSGYFPATLAPDQSPGISSGGKPGDFIAISSLGGTGLVLRSDGKILCWGS